METKSLSRLQWGVIKAFVHSLCFMPFALIVRDVVNNLLGADPIQTLHFRTGDWALRFLFITLSITPLMQLLKTSAPIRFRRMFGLYAFFYASLHLSVWLVLDQSLSLENMFSDVPESPYIILGLSAYGLLIPLAMTSTAAMMRRLGMSWFSLHKLIYAIAIMGVVHFFWLTKLDYTEPLIYAVLLALLLVCRRLILKTSLVSSNKVN